MHSAKAKWHKMNYTLDTIKNVRSLDGIPTKDGRKVKKGVFFRGAALDKLTENEIDILTNQWKIKHVFDFRDESEYLIMPDIVPKSAEYHLLPVLPNIEKERHETWLHMFYREPASSYKLLYTVLATSQEAQDSYGKFLRIIADSNGEPVYWHCTQGKDRTGIAALLLLHILGVEEKYARDDYFITNELVRDDYEAMMKSDLPLEQKKIREIMTFVSNDYLDIYYNTVNKNYGGLDSYIKEKLRVDEQEVESLKQLYLE